MDADRKNIATFMHLYLTSHNYHPRTHILLLACYIYNSGVDNFSPIILKNAFLKARLPVPASIDTKLAELSSGDKPPLIKTQSRFVLSIYGDGELKSYLKDKPQIETGVEVLKELLTKVQK